MHCLSKRITSFQRPPFCGLGGIPGAGGRLASVLGSSASPARRLTAQWTLLSLLPHPATCATAPRADSRLPQASFQSPLVLRFSRIYRGRQSFSLLIPASASPPQTLQAQLAQSSPRPSTIASFQSSKCPHEGPKRRVPASSRIKHQILIA